MTRMITELYDASREAGASDEKARKAGEAMAAYENRFARIDGDLNLLKWMGGFNLAAATTPLALALKH